MRGKNASSALRRNAFPALHSKNFLRIALLAAALLLPLLLGEGFATPRSTASNKPTIDRRARTILHRFAITPHSAKVASNQSQRFAVTDAQGKPISVHWVISGLGCEGADCGTVDDSGVYHPPVTLPKPPVVTLEGVVISDPRYSVLTEIHLEKTVEPDAIAASPNRENLAARINLPSRVVVSPAPVIERSSVPQPADNISLPRAVDAVPLLDTSKLAAGGKNLPLPSVVAAAATIERVPVPHRPNLPLMQAAGAPPAIGTLKSRSATSKAAVPLPNVIAASPTIDRPSTITVRGAELSSLHALEPAPSPVNRMVIDTAALPLPSVIAALPSVQSSASSHSANFGLPRAVEAAPNLATRVTPANGNALPLPSVIAAPATIKEALSLRKKKGLPLPHAIEAMPTLGEPQLLASASLLPLPSVIDAVPGIEKASGLHSSNLPLARPVEPAPTITTQVTQIRLLPALSSAISATPIIGQPRPVALPLSAALVQPQQPRFDQPSVKTDTRNSAKAFRLHELPKSSAKLLSSANSQVEYHDGLLTIHAQNVTLAEVLQQVAEKTGATVDAPPSAGLEHIVEHYGPGPAKEVLAHLLYGSSFNFILVSSPQNPENLATILLSRQSDSAITPPTDPIPNALASKSWTPPDDTTTMAVLPAHLDESLEIPKDKMSPEALSDFMKQKFQELREKAQQQYPQ